MRKTYDHTKLDFIVPVSIDTDLATKESVTETILELKENYGFERFLLCGPNAGFRATGIPPKSHYKKMAELFIEIRDAVAPHGVTCGWWNCLTLKSGASEEFQRMVKANGSEAPFANCPLDPAFQKAFAERNAYFCEIAKPAFVCFEDDYAIGAAAGRMGCFCKFHLDAFAKREGKFYSREELVEAFNSKAPENIELYKRWCALRADSMASISEAVRREVDKKTPEIPFGLMQSASCDMDGDSTLPITKAMAGQKHTPFSRLHGTVYCDVYNAKNLPVVLYHAIYDREHIKGDFVFYHEMDTFPHTRFFMSAAKVRAMQGIVFSHNFDGSIFYNCQILDDLTEEKAYAKMFLKERKRFDAVHNISKQCLRHGVEIAYDPFSNTSEDLPDTPYWTESVSLFGIPFVTTEADVAFWDARQARYSDHDTIIRHLSKGLFLDAEAAKILNERGYGKYIGVEIGENIAKGTFAYDLAAREIIKAPFDTINKGKTMPIAHFYSPRGTGEALEMKITYPKAEVITENFNGKMQYICPAMVRFKNELGGRIVVLGMTMERNSSHSLLNYRRQRLFHALLKWCTPNLLFAENQPNIFTVVNKAENPKESGFYGMITLVNLGDDPVEQLSIHLPPEWRNKSFSILNREAEWVDANVEQAGEHLILKNDLYHCDPCYILVK